MAYKGQKKRINPNETHGFIGDKPTKKSIPKPWIESPVITQYKKDRNMYWLNDMFTSEETKQQIRDIYGI